MEWIKISDRFPEIHEYVLVYDGEAIFIAALSNYGNNWFCMCNCDDGSVVENPTHWMPLPEMPKPRS